MLDSEVVLLTKILSKKGATIDAWYSGKIHDFGGNVQAPTRPMGSRSGSRRSSRAWYTT